MRFANIDEVVEYINRRLKRPADVEARRECELQIVEATLAGDDKLAAELTADLLRANATSTPLRVNLRPRRAM